MRLSIIIPTIGRKSLIPLLDDLRVQIYHRNHEVIVVEDGSESMHDEVTVRNFNFIATEKSDDIGIGSHQRNIGIQFSSGTHIAFLDDDDEVSPTYIETIEKRVTDNKLYLFRIFNGETIIWTQKLIKLGNVSTQMIVVPNASQLPEWRTDVYESDFHFIEACAEQFPVSWEHSFIAKRGISKVHA